MRALPRTFSSKAIRAGGASAIVGALLILVGSLWGTVITSGMTIAEAYDSSGTTLFLATLVGLTGAILLVFGLIGLYAVQAERAGGWGLAGFALAMIGTLLFVGSMWTQTFAAPSLSIEAPEFLQLIDAGEVGGPLPIGMAVSGILSALGLLTFGIATYRAEVFHKATAVALMIGAILLAVPMAWTTIPVTLVVAWMGYRTFTAPTAAPSGDIRENLERAERHISTEEREREASHA
ncbi:MAG: hypothetical protein R3320_10465 [Nitriliruptorales bacterium]|nr:hypothetical protein [Nitriliruptorales bacterium]